MARTTFGALLALLLGAGAAEAQATIRPGMTRAEVEAAFGQPAAVRTADGWTYLYYPNGCPRRCGSDDVVFLRDGRVVAAVLRSPRRRFAGPPASLALQQVPDARTPCPRDGGHVGAVGRRDCRMYSPEPGCSNWRVDRGSCSSTRVRVRTGNNPGSGGSTEHGHPREPGRGRARVRGARCGFSPARGPGADSEGQPYHRQLRNL